MQPASAGGLVSMQGPLDEHSTTQAQRRYSSHLAHHQAEVNHVL